MRYARSITALALAVTALVPTLRTDPVLPEDSEDPAYDCRWDGNQQCGVEIEGSWYVVTFLDGSPESIVIRPGADSGVPVEEPAP